MTLLRIAVLETQITNTYENVGFRKEETIYDIDVTIEFNSVGDQIHWEFTNSSLTQVAGMLFWPHEQENNSLFFHRHRNRWTLSRTQ
jgi:hypothetical protein